MANRAKRDRDVQVEANVQAKTNATTENSVQAEANVQGRSHADAAAPAFGAFVDTIATLRAPGGCPWDREQTHASIAKNMIEEAYEAVDTIEAADWMHLREELGDVLLQVVLQSQIAADAQEFTIADVVTDVNAKMIHRHPHVFGDAQAESASEVLTLWDQVKLNDARIAQTEASVTSEPAGLLDGVRRHFPRSCKRKRFLVKRCLLDLSGIRLMRCGSK